MGTGPPPDVPADSNWVTAFGSPGPTHIEHGARQGYARTLALAPNGDVYVGGAFSIAGGVPASNVARWDGEVWSPLGAGVNSHRYTALYPNGQVLEVTDPIRGDAPVKALAVGPDGSVYAGGHFTRAGGQPAAGVARWDGGQWHAMGAGLIQNVAACEADWQTCSNVRALAVGPDGAVYAGGNFARTGDGALVNNVARWDGSAWRPLGTGASVGVNGAVHALAFGPDGALYAGGAFTTAGGVAAPYVARWDGSSWARVHAEALDGPVNALAVHDGSVYVGGEFTRVGSRRADRVVRWDGTAWRVLLDGLNFGAPYPVYGVAADAGGVYVTMVLYNSFGYPSSVQTDEVALAHWDGSAWGDLSPVPPSSPDNRFVKRGCYAVASRDEDVVAGCGGPGGIGRYDRTAGQWRMLGGPSANAFLRADYEPGDINDFAMGSNRALYVGGRFEYVGDRPARNIVSWNEGQVDLMGGGPPNYSVSALAVHPSDVLYVAAERLSTDPGIVVVNGQQYPATLWAWDGQGWTAVGHARGIGDIEIDAQGDLYVGTSYYKFVDASLNVIESTSGMFRFDGSAWSPLEPPEGNVLFSKVIDVEISQDSTVYILHQFLPWEPVIVGAYYGGSWTVIADEFEPIPCGGGACYPLGSSIEIGPDGELYLAGKFSHVEGVIANSLARWDGSSWSRVGAGFAFYNGIATYPAGVSTVEWVHGALHVAGTFNRVYQEDGTETVASVIVRRDGTEFSPIGSGLDQAQMAPDALFARGGELWVGGSGRTGRGYGPSVYDDPTFVDDEAAPPAGAPGLVLSSPWPNPTRGPVRLRYELPRPDHVRLEVFDVLGRRVATLADGPLPEGEHHATFGAAAFPAGLYLVRLTVGGRAVTRPVTVTD